MNIRSNTIYRLLRTSTIFLFVTICIPPTYSQEINDSIAIIKPQKQSWEDIVINKLTCFAKEADKSYFNTGISVYDLTTDSLIFGYNEQKMLRPASTEKVLTAVSALDLLGVSHNYTTLVYSKGIITTDSSTTTTDSTVLSILNGNIYVIGDFDPEIDSSSINEIAAAIKNKGINKINGMLIADLSMKDTLCLGNGWCWDDEQPFLTPLSFKGKAYQCNNYKINRYSPAANFLSMLTIQLKAEGVTVLGCDISNYKSDSTSVILCKITHPIADILRRMMKNSDNLYAESMFYQLAADKKKGISWKDCAEVVKGVVNKAGVSAEDVEVADGSGLSLYNYLTPSTLVAILRYAYIQGGIFDALYNSLPIAGVDGTLSSRMTSGAPYCNVHAKTGTLTGVSALAGYLTASNGHLIAFSIINNGLRKVADGRAFQDRICYALCE